MTDVLAWLALILWIGALALRVHPHTRTWAPRGMSGRATRVRAGVPLPAPPLPPPPVPVGDLVTVPVPAPRDPHPLSADLPEVHR